MRVGIKGIQYTATKSKETRNKTLVLASTIDSGKRKLINKSLIATLACMFLISLLFVAV